MKKSNDTNKIPWWVWICGLFGLFGIAIYKEIVPLNVKDIKFVGILIMGVTIIVFIALTTLITRKR